MLHRSTGGRGMKLGKTKDVETFVDQLKSEGENVSNKIKKNVGAVGQPKNTPAVSHEALVGLTNYLPEIVLPLIILYGLGLNHIIYIY